MTITVNGASREVADGTTVQQLLASLGVHPRLVAVEVTGEILPRDRYAATVLRAAETVEIVQMVGGGA